MEGYEDDTIRGCVVVLADDFLAAGFLWDRGHTFGCFGAGNRPTKLEKNLDGTAVWALLGR
jgi:hypothetical protein